MARRVTTHKKRTNESDYLTIVTVFEEKLGKQEIKRLNPYTKTQEILVFNKHSHAYEYKKA